MKPCNLKTDATAFQLNLRIEFETELDKKKIVKLSVKEVNRLSRD